MRGFLLVVAGCNGLLGVHEFPDAAIAIDAPADAPCIDSLEPNDHTDQATPTQFDSTPSTSVAGVSLCPAGDRDVYRVAISHASETLFIHLEAQPVVTLQLDIIDAAGTFVVGGTTQMDAAFVLEAPGTYFVSVRAADATVTAVLYKLTLSNTAD